MTMLEAFCAGYKVNRLSNRITGFARYLLRSDHPRILMFIKGEGREGLELGSDIIAPTGASCLSGAKHLAPE